MSERVPEALEMSDTEILDWMGDNLLHLGLSGSGADIKFSLHAWGGIRSTGVSIREAVNKVAPRLKEDNRDF